MTFDDAQIDGLLGAARNGDAAAFDRLVSGLRPRIYRWALVIVGDADDADDVAQQVSMTLHRKLRDFERRSRFTTWLYTITRNSAIELTRRASRKHETSMDQEQLSDRGAELPRQQIDRIADERKAALVRSFFSELPARQRELIELIDSQGYSTAEAAELMGIEPETARVHLLRARRLIRGRMLELHPEVMS
ncbi:MAG TPA: RNA polymerase sigma factor [Longimicrobiales bacterium]